MVISKASVVSSTYQMKLSKYYWRRHYSQGAGSERVDQDVIDCVRESRALVLCYERTDRCSAKDT